MTNDKALEAALLPCPFCGGTFGAQGASKDMISVWCSCGAEGPKVPFPEINPEPIVAIHECIRLWNRRAPLSSLPGEAEVVWTSTSAMRTLKAHYPQCEVLPAHLQPTDQHTFGLVTLASFQAMQARAEAAERERDEALAFVNYAEDVSKVVVARAEAAEARVKELEEALKPFIPGYEPWMDRHADNVGLSFYRPATFGDLRRARTALKGGSNG